MGGDSLGQRRAALERSLAQRRFGARLAGGETLRIPHTRIPHLFNDDVLGDALTMPAAGRAYAAYLGQHDKAFTVDLAAAQELAGTYEATVEAARENRAWVLRAVAAAVQEGVCQFIDLGAGPPLTPSVAAVARDAMPDGAPPPAVVYVDSDPSVTEQTRILDARGENVTAITADLRKPADVFGNPALLERIDLSRPVCVLMASVLHFMSPDEALESVYRVTARLAPGSLVAISVGTGADEKVIAKFNQVHGEGTVHLHERGHIASYLAHLEMLEPGLTWARDWRPDETVHYAGDSHVLAGMGRKRASS